MENNKDVTTRQEERERTSSSTWVNGQKDCHTPQLVTVVGAYKVS